MVEDRATEKKNTIQQNLLLNDESFTQKQQNNSSSQIECSLHYDIEKGLKIANILYDAFRTTGIFGMQDMPEDAPPRGVKLGSLEHIIFLTLSVAIDYQRDGHSMWDASRATWEDPETRYLFDVYRVSEVPFEKVLNDMKKYKLSKKHRNDTKIWITIADSFAKKWEGNPLNFLEDCEWDAIRVLDRLKVDRHLSGNRSTKDFPYLGGNKIGPLWLRMLRDNAGISSIKNMDQVPIPVDVHIARASLCLGIVNGKYSGSVEPIYQDIRRAWAESVKGLEVEGRPMIAIDVDEPLWHLSKFGCSKRNGGGICPKKNECIVSDYCVSGRIEVNSEKINLESNSPPK